jgi:hypothetical protein
MTNSTRRGDVVVLDENRVVEAFAMVGDASGCGRGFLEEAQAWGGFAGVEYFAVGAFDDLGELVGERGYAGEPLEEIESYALTFEEGAGPASDLRDQIAFAEVVAVCVFEGEIFYASACFVDGRQDFGTCQYEGLSGYEMALGHAVRWYAGFSGDIARTNIFFEGEADDLERVNHSGARLL